MKLVFDTFLQNIQNSTLKVMTGCCKVKKMSKFCSELSTFKILFQWKSIIKLDASILVKYKADVINTHKKKKYFILTELQLLPNLYYTCSLFFCVFISTSYVEEVTRQTGTITNPSAVTEYWDQTHSYWKVGTFCFVEIYQYIIYLHLYWEIEIKNIILYKLH